MSNLIEKIITIQKELTVPKGRWNDFGGYNYRNCEDILEAVKPHLVKHGLLQTLSDSIEESNGSNYVKATVTVTDGTDSVETTAYAREINQKKKMDSSQLTGTASSYARKYALNGMWNIDDVKDPDTNEFEREKKERSKKPKLTPDSPKWSDAVDNLASGKVTLAKIKKHYDVSDENKLQSEARQKGEG